MKKVLVQLVAVAAVGTVIAIPGPAHAESCVTVPVGSSGFTLEAGGQSVRIPAIASASVCYELPGTPGIPWVKTEYGGASVVITGGSDDGGHVELRYVADGVTREVGVPIPALGGGGSETCLVGVGSPYARPDCAVKLHADQLVPSPLPTAPPIPTTGPVPTVPPVQTPPPDEFCATNTACTPYGGSVLREPWDNLVIFVRDTVNALEDEAAQLQEDVDDFLFGPCGVLNLNSTC